MIWLWLLGGGAVAWYLFGSSSTTKTHEVPTNTLGLVTSAPNVYIDENGLLVLPNTSPPSPMPQAGTYATTVTDLRPLPGELDPMSGTTYVGPGASQPGPTPIGAAQQQARPLFHRRP